MSSVSERSGSIEEVIEKPLSEVKRGFTYFAENDVIFAKITPCMQNGKSAIARNLKNGLGFGSTEFHVIRPAAKVLPEWLYYFVRQQSFLDEAKSHFRGSAGQQRVPSEFISGHKIPLPPLDEQRRIVGRIKECLGRVDEIKRLREEAQQEVNALQAASLNEIEKGLSCPMAKVNDIIEDSQNGRSIRSDEINYNGHVLTLSAIRTLELDVEQRKPVQLTDSIAEKYEIKTNDVFISRANTIELVGLASILTTAAPERTIYPDLMIKLTPILAKVRPKYLALALRFPSVRRQIQYHAKGSSQSMVKISGASLREVAIPLPSLDEQEAIVAKADEARNVTALLKAEFDQKAVDGLTQAILRKAFAGEL